MYCIMRIEKRKRQDIGGLQRENNRTATEYNNRVEPGMDILNVDLLHSDNWMQDIQQEIDSAGTQTARGQTGGTTGVGYTGSNQPQRADGTRTR